MHTECDVLSRYNTATAAWHAPPLATYVSGLQRSCHPLRLSPSPYRRRLSSPSFSTKKNYKIAVTQRRGIPFLLSPLVARHTSHADKEYTTMPLPNNNFLSLQEGIASRLTVVASKYFGRKVPLDSPFRFRRFNSSSVPRSFSRHLHLSNQTDSFDVWPNTPRSIRVNSFFV